MIKLLNIINEETLVEQASGIANMAKKFSNLGKAKEGNGVLKKGIKQNTLQAEVELRNSIIQNFKISEELLAKSVPDLQKEMNKEILIRLKAGDRGELPKTVKEYSRTLAAKDILSQNKILSADEIVRIIEKRTTNTLNLFKKRQLSFTNPKVAKPKDTNVKATEPQKPSEVSVNKTVEKPVEAPKAEVPKTEPVVGEPIAPVIPLTPNGGGIVSNLLNNLKRVVKIKAGVTIVSILVISGVVYYILSDGTKQPVEDSDFEAIKKTLNPCLKPLISNGGKITFSNDKPILTVVKTGNPDYDAKGGLAYYPNGRVVSVDKSIRGTWSCKEPIAENKIKLNLIGLLNEEVDELTMARDVDTMIDYLDIPASEQNLKDALDLLTKYSTETINGQNAGKLFLKKYIDGGTGDADIKTSLKYIIAIKETTKYYKEKLLALVNQIESGKTSSPTKTNSSVNIIWDKDSLGSTQPASQVKKEQIHYKPCDTFPFVKGCKSEKIKDIQSKLGFEYQNGNYGPITIAKLKELGWFDKTANFDLTQDMYNAIMGINKTEPTQQPASVVKPEPQKVTEPEIDRESPSGEDSPVTPSDESPSTTDTNNEKKPQPNNAIREYLLQNINKNLVGNLVYSGAILDDNQDKYLDDYVKEKYGTEYNRDKNREKIGKNRQRTVFKK